MTGAEFKRKWARFTGKESAAYQSHFDDLCRLVGVPPPLEADPTGDFFCFQKRVVKDAELFDLHETPDASEPNERGFADVWRKGCFAWEYKGRKKNLEEAYRQLLRYRESLLNPPLLVVCDFDRYIIRTNFNGTVQETHEFNNAQIDDPKNLALLRAVFTDPDFLKPQKTTAQVTEALAETIAEVAKSLQKREAEELADARTRAEMNFAQRKNLRIARFLNRIVFCFFAEDSGLLPKRLFSEVLTTGLDDPRLLAETLEKLFAVMAKGGTFGKDKIRHFNGHLFEEFTVFQLEEDELRKLADAGEADWQFIQPSIMGTLFERALEPEQRSQLGAHYTSEADIKTLVEPVLMAPLRREWAALKLVGDDVRRRDAASEASRRSPNPKSFQPPHVGSYRAKLEAFQRKLAAVSVLDPACGSGNFLYVSLQLLLGLEKEVVTHATQLGFKLAPQVSVQQLRAIEINPYAFELAQVSVQIGFLQWRRDNGFDNDRSPVLQNLDGFQNEDALLVPHFRSKAKTLKEAQAGEHAGDDALKFYTERDWPKCDVIVSNPPFLGGSKLWEELGRHYQQELWRVYENRVPGFADLCCYWFEKARQQIEQGKCKRAGLLATQGIRGGANRKVLKRIKETGDIFFAESDRDWVLAGANVHVSMVGFDDGSDKARVLDGKNVETVNANLTAASDTTQAQVLQAALGQSYMGSSKKGPFDIPESAALELLKSVNPHGKPNSDVVRPWANGLDITRLPQGMWIIDFPPSMSEGEAALYEGPFVHVREIVKPERDKNKREAYRRRWWIHAEPRPELRALLKGCERFVGTPTLSKYRLFVWPKPFTLPDQQLIAFPTSSDFVFGILHSRFHELWGLRQGTFLETRPRYTPTTCFETFPFPFPDDLPPPETAPELLVTSAACRSRRKEAQTPPSLSNQSLVTSTPTALRAAIAAAAQELNDLRERWLNPPEWTETRVLEFPGTVGGPWDRYIARDGESEKRSAGESAVSPSRRPADSPSPLIGIVRYPRLEPKDADCAAKLKKRTLTNLYNERPAWLDLAHKKLDDAVAAAYGWPADLTDEQILERLLALNLERAAKEAKAAKVKKPKATREKHADEML